MSDKAMTAAELGELIMKSNPYPLYGTGEPYSMIAPRPKPPNSGSRAERRAMAVDLRELLYSLTDHDYEVGGVLRINYINDTYDEEEVDPKDPKKRKTHRLWIVYGSGGE
jgi:hypothetical protein